MRHLFPRVGRVAAAVALSASMIVVSGVQPVLGTTSLRPVLTPVAAASSAGPNCSYFVWPQKDSTYSRYLWGHAQWSTVTPACRSWTGVLYLDAQTTTGYVAEESNCIGIDNCVTPDNGRLNTAICYPLNVSCDYFPSTSHYPFTGRVRARLRVDGTAGPGQPPFTYYTGSWLLWPGDVPVRI